MKKQIAKAVCPIFIAVILVLSAIFLIGRYGWQLFGFTACESAGIENVEVFANEAKITGFYPGSFPRGFLGYHAEEENGILYVGFKFSGLFGIFETGDFNITIPVKGEIREVIIKTKNDEYPVWPEFGSTVDLPTDPATGGLRTGSMSCWNEAMCIRSIGILKAEAAVSPMQIILL